MIKPERQGERSGNTGTVPGLNCTDETGEEQPRRITSPRVCSGLIRNVDQQRDIERRDAPRDGLRRRELRGALTGRGLLHGSSPKLVG